MNSKQTEMQRNDKILEEHGQDVTAKALKGVLWETIGDLRRRKIKVEEADAISKAAAGILATVKLELEVGKMMGLASQSLADFTMSNYKAPLPSRLDLTEEYEKKALASMEPQKY